MSKATWERYKRAEWETRVLRLLVTYALLLTFIGAMLIIGTLSGCSTPNYGGSCSVNDRLLGDC